MYYIEMNRLQKSVYIKGLIKRDLDSKGITYPDSTDTDID